jgi:replication factor C subunit 2/4
VLELNASDSRGIDVVRNRIKMFAMKKVTLPPGQHKIIILDEADSMTTAAQQALRRTMEIFSHTTRFALACNNSTKIIEPIQSRCAILRFSRLSDEEVLARLQKVCEAEKVSYTSDGLAAIIFTAEGDMRNALNNLQSTHSGFKHVSQETVFKVCDQPHPAVVLDILQACVQSDIYTAQRLMKALYDTGYSTSDIIGTVFKVCTYQLQVPEAAQLELIKEIGFTHMRIADGVNSLLQLLGLCARLCKRSTELNLGSARR